MKQNLTFSVQNLLIVICLICLGTIYGQDTNSTDKTLFGKSVSSKNINPKNGITRCATTEYEQYLQAKNPKRMTNAQFETWLAPLVKKYKSMRTSSQIGQIITIPVVVHVIYDGQALGVAPNITDAQVISQINVLNEDYSKTGLGSNTNPVGADTKIRFALALQDPNGNPTNGIDRVSLCQPSWSDIDIESTLKPSTIWNPSLYLNMWCVKFTDNTLLGYAQFPDASGLSGLGTSGGSSNTDGVVSNYDVFGSIKYNDGSFLLDGTYNQGRTMTHEVGHWLGLLHIWGDAACGDDYCADTPVHHDANYGCPSPIPLSCDTPPVNEMIQNYMDYTDDACMNIFTQNQTDRITTIINNSARRNSLRSSTKNAAIPLFANDAEVKLVESCPVSICGGVTNQTIKRIILYNRGTATLTSASLNYSINGGSNIVYNWTGSLATNKYATIDITINSTSNGTIAASVVNANGVTDQRASNNTASGTYVIPTNPINYTFNTFKFTLQQDYFGKETTWNLKNSSGVVIYQGGPYTNTYVDDNTVSVVPDLIVQNWSLTNNECYTFTIKDSSGDGICCGTNLGGSGDGYYNIKSADDAITIKSGASFTSSESISFSTNTLATMQFENSNDIIIYPNPTKNVINIKVSNDFGLPDNYTIYNNLGQIISQSKVSSKSDLTVNTSSLSNGVYSISVEKGGQKKSLQFIKE
jgi:hypothetical protein